MFTLTTGYNLVWSSWLVGIQSEASLNRNHIRLVRSGRLELGWFYVGPGQCVHPEWPHLGRRR
jgi:hypothetical protein